MKIIITGKNGYVANSLKQYFEKCDGENVKINLISLRDNSWKEIDFSTYDCVIHTAALVHQNEKLYTLEDYEKINKVLTLELAHKAMIEGVKKFIFLSSMSVYGIESGEIDPQLTECKPVSMYGKSKLAAENELKALLEEASCKLTIFRPPMIYGPDLNNGIKCPGNYQRLKKLVSIIPVFPQISNKRSMVYIDKLCEEIRSVVMEHSDKSISYVFPQDESYMSTSNLVKIAATECGKTCFLIPGLSCILNIVAKYNKTINKIVGSLVYRR